MQSLKRFPISTLIYYYSLEPTKEILNEILTRFKFYDREMLDLIINAEVEKMRINPNLYQSSLVNSHSNIERLLYLYLEANRIENQTVFSELVFLSNNFKVKKYTDAVLNMALQNIEKRLCSPNEDYELLITAKANIQFAQIELKTQKIDDDILVEKLSGNFNLGIIDEMLDIDFFQDCFSTLVVLQDWKRLKPQRDFLYRSISNEENLIDYTKVLKKLTNKNLMQ